MGGEFTAGLIVGSVAMFVINLAVNVVMNDARERRRHSTWRRETWRQHDRHDS